MNYWLIKSEPAAWSWTQQVAAGKAGTAWTGVRNYQARNNLAAMQPGDLALFYHSVTEKKIVGIARVIGAAQPDETAPADSGWVAPQIAYLQEMQRPVSLDAIKANPKLAGMALLRQSRLSVCPVAAAEFREVLKMSGTKLAGL